MSTAPAPPKRVALVLAGAGARGCYEIGVLDILLPRLAAAGAVPTLYIGTSAGAINATLLAASAHLPPDQQCAAALDLWGAIRTRDVFRSPLATGAGTALRLVGQSIGVRGARLTGLLDTSPLRSLADNVLDWEQLHHNLAESRELAVVATSGSDNRTVVFVAGRKAADLPQSDDERPIDYRAAEISAEHVLASAAIPVLFPPVQVAAPQGDGPGEWFLDGGVRLNAPLKPALALGADAVVVIATHPIVDHVTAIPRTAEDLAPDVDDTVVRVLDAALVDRMVEDVKNLARTNLLVDKASRARGEPPEPYRVVPYLAIGPPDRGTLAELASAVFHRRRGKLEGARRFLTDPSMRILGHVTDGDGGRRGDLMSYLYFDPEFADAAMDRGRADASAALAGVPEGVVPWQVGPVPASRLTGAPDAGP